MSGPGSLRVAAAALLLAAAAGARADTGTRTLAVSRQVTMHAFGSRPTIAVSRQVTMHVAGLRESQAASRQITIYVNFRIPDAANALRVAAGLSAADPATAAIYNVVGPGNTLDLSDVAEIARLATGKDHRM